MGGRGSSSGKAMSTRKGETVEDAKKRYGEKGKSNIPVITYATPSQKEQMRMDITNQFFDNYKKYGKDGQQANIMIIDGFLKEGIIDSEMAASLRDVDKKIRILEALELNPVKKEQPGSIGLSKNSKSNHRGGLGMPSEYVAVTSTYKRFKQRQKKKFDSWWKASHGES